MSWALVLYADSVVDQHCQIDWEDVQNWAPSIFLHAVPRLLAFAGRSTPFSQGLDPPHENLRIARRSRKFQLNLVTTNKAESNSSADSCQTILAENNPDGTQ